MLDAVISSKHSYLLLCSVGKCKVPIVLLSSSFLLCYLISFISILILALASSCTFRFFLFVKSLPLCLIKFFIFIKKWSIDMCTSRSLIICTDSDSHLNLIWEAHKESVPLLLCIPILTESGLIWVFQFKVACSFQHITQYEAEIW